MKTTRKIISMASILLLTVLLTTAAHAGETNDGDALARNKQGKIIFDVNLTEANKMVLYLSVIKQTHFDLQKQHIKPDIVLAFRGLAVTLIQDTIEIQSHEEQMVFEQIRMLIEELQSLGMKMEACSVATGLFQVPNDTILPGIKVVGNTFVSLMGYQNQGYAIIPIM